MTVSLHSPPATPTAVHHRTAHVNWQMGKSLARSGKTNNEAGEAEAEECGKRRLRRQSCCWRYGDIMNRILGLLRPTATAQTGVGGAAGSALQFGGKICKGYAASHTKQMLHLC